MHFFFLLYILYSNNNKYANQPPQLWHIPAVVGISHGLGDQRQLGIVTAALALARIVRFIVLGNIHSIYLVFKGKGNYFETVYREGV